MLYSLEIVEAILIKDQESKSTHDWINSFLQKDGIEVLQKMLQNALEEVDKGDKTKYIDQILKILRLLILNSSKNLVQ